MTNEQLRAALALLGSQQKKLLEKPKRDAWEKLSVFAPLITGLVITITSLYISNQYQVAQKAAADQKDATVKASDERDKQFQQKLARSELLQKFIPYLKGNEDEASMAIVAIGATGDAELMQIVAKMNPNTGVKKGLALVAENGPSAAVRKAASRTLGLVETVDLVSKTQGGSSYGRRALQLALDAVKNGVKENGIGNNRGNEIDEYNKALNVPVGSPWCASFISWCYLTALPEGATPPFKFSAAVSHIQSNLTEAGRWRTKDSNYTPKPGDIVIYEARTPEAHHLGIVVNADSNRVYAIEGNISATDDSPDGTAVVGKERPLSAVRGFGEIPD